MRPKISERRPDSTAGESLVHKLPKYSSRKLILEVYIKDACKQFVPKACHQRGTALARTRKDSPLRLRPAAASIFGAFTLRLSAWIPNWGPLRIHACLHAMLGEKNASQHGRFQALAETLDYFDRVADVAHGSRLGSALAQHKRLPRAGCGACDEWTKCCCGVVFAFRMLEYEVYQACCLSVIGKVALQRKLDCWWRS